MKLDADAKTLLYVEDEPETVQLFQTAMQQVGAVFQLEAAASLEAAFMVLDRAAAKPMAVLLDFSLGRFKGTDLLRWMRGRPEYLQIEVAVFSGLDSERQWPRATRPAQIITSSNLPGLSRSSTSLTASTAASFVRPRICSSIPW